MGGLTDKEPPTTIIVYDGLPAHSCKTWLNDGGPGRNVLRLSGMTEFLPEETFQQEMRRQDEALGREPKAVY